MSATRGLQFHSSRSNSSRGKMFVNHSMRGTYANWTVASCMIAEPNRSCAEAELLVLAWVVPQWHDRDSPANQQRSRRPCAAFEQQFNQSSEHWNLRDRPLRTACRSESHAE
jgi:hypothetical protein